MKIVFVSGSSRKDSQSIKVANWLSGQLEKLEVETEIVDLYKHELPTNHEDIWSDVMGKPAMSLQKILEPADGYVVIAAEWNGMVPPSLKNFFCYVGKSMADKPSLIAAVSSTAHGGAYPISELRMSSYKNARILYLPEHIRIMNVNQVMNGETDHGEIETRAIYSLKVLAEYARALKSVRDSGVTDYKIYQNGM
ncbi:NAD(P)H-dependent oxidoreductase [Candidatus Saccharibacteria bacterium]|jgi:azobenzene reductase|nr:NAD(P)H-dependent oxidoreductase [Candidatus Saccharibacteria bacterium]